MASPKIIITYLGITFSIIIPVALLALLCNGFGAPIYGTEIGFVAIAVGGLSTAIAGVITAKVSRRISHFRTVFLDFFRLKSHPLSYITIIGFLFLIFGNRIVRGQMQEGRQLWELPLLFLTAIVFGGVEEIGWRYLYQTTLEKHMSFPLFSFLTFVAWAAGISYTLWSTVLFSV